MAMSVLTVGNVLVLIVCFNCLHNRQVEKEERKEAAALEKRRRELPNWMHCRISSQISMRKPVEISMRKLVESIAAEPVEEIEHVVLKLFFGLIFLVLLPIYLRERFGWPPSGRAGG